MDLEEERKQKQDFLRSQILDNEYDGQQFADYCYEVKGDVDIDGWSVGDLVQLVRDFVKTKGKRGEQTKGSSIGSKEFEEFGKVEGMNQNKPQELNFQFIPKLNEHDLNFLSTVFMAPQATRNPQPTVVHKKPPADALNKLQTNINAFMMMEGTKGNTREFKVSGQGKKEEGKEVGKEVGKGKQIEKVSTSQIKQPLKPTIPILLPHQPQPPTTTTSKHSLLCTIPCKKSLTRSLLPHCNPQTYILSHQIVKTGLFSDTTLYHLTTTPINIEVKRRFKDFQLLKCILRKMFPSTRLPYLQKNSKLTELQQSFMLECFVNDLLLNEQLQNCRIVEEFLTMKDMEQFKKKFKEYEKGEKVRAIEMMTSASGNVQIAYSQKNVEYNEKIQGYIEGSEKHYQRISQLYEQLVNNIQMFSKTLMDISQAFTLLETSTKTFNSSVSTNQFPTLQKTYHYISQLNKQWSNSVKAQCKLIDSDIKTHFKYQKQNLGTLRQLIKTQSTITESYTKRQPKQHSTQQYSSPKLDQYKTSIDLPSKHIVVLQYQNAYWSSKVTSQGERMFKELGVKLRREFGRFSKLQGNICGGMREMWVEGAVGGGGK